MSTKGIGTTVDATTIPFSCISINSKQNVLSSNNNQQDKQTKFFQKRAEFWRSSEECFEEMGGDNVAEDGSNQSGTWKLRREAKWISKRVRDDFPTPIK
jgi:hypothetical protein